jgi:hypothetical protein
MKDGRAKREHWRDKVAPARLHAFNIQQGLPVIQHNQGFAAFQEAHATRPIARAHRKTIVNAYVENNPIPRLLPDTWTANPEASDLIQFALNHPDSPARGPAAVLIHEAAVYEQQYIANFDLLNPETAIGENKYELSITRDPERIAVIHGALTLLSAEGQRELRSSARGAQSDAYEPVSRAATDLAAALWSLIYQRHENEKAEVRAFADAHDLPVDQLVAAVDQRFNPTLEQLSKFVVEHPKRAVLAPDQLPLGFLGVEKI